MGAQLGASVLKAAANIDIGKSETGVAPSEFDLSKGRWTVVADSTATAGIVIEQSGGRTTEDRFPLAICKAAALKNAEISLRLKAAGGTSDQGGGVALRLSSPKDYYLVRLDALRDQVLFSRVSNDASKEIVAVDADIALHVWHTLSVRANDNEFVVTLDGIWVFTAFDKALSQPGRVALWTKGDSITRFDQIEIVPLP
jgi:hypothetical protein